jgi:putative ABC transport system permease protein
VSTWRVPVRLALRDALRHRVRSLLIVLLILVPVAAATGVDILYSTGNSTDRAREMQFGAADAMVVSGPDPVDPAAVQAALPTGSRLVPLPITNSVHLGTTGHLTEADVFLTDHLTDELTRHQIQLTAGRSPAAAGEIALSSSTARALGLRGSGIGATISLDSGQSLTVTGLVREPFCLDCRAAAAPTNSPAAPAVRAGMSNYAGSYSYAIALPAGTRPADVESLALHNVEWRDQVGAQTYSLGDLGRADSRQLQTAAVVTLIAGLGLLEIVLLAGTAFAVGARRQVRDLGLLAAQGAGPAQVRIAVLAQGLALGAIGSVGGVAAGFAIVRASRSLIERWSNEVMVGTHFGVAEVLIAAGVGVLSGVAAAWFPARTAARRRVLDALASRFPAPTARTRRAPIVGALLLVLGCGIALLASAAMSRGRSGSWFAYAPLTAVNEYRVQRYGGLSDTTGALAVLVGVFTVVAGILLLTPALMALLARLGRHLSPTLRMASRDAARHRHRTGPATAAIAVAVGGAVAISYLIASDKEGPDSVRIASVPERVIAVTSTTAYDTIPTAHDKIDTALQTASSAASTLLPGATVIPLQYLRGTPPSSTSGSVSVDDVTVSNGLHCTGGCPGGSIQNVAVGTPDLVMLATGRTGDRAAITAALDTGKVLVLDPDAIDSDGTVLLHYYAYPTDGSAEPTEQQVRLPALAIPQPKAYGELPRAFVSADVAEAQRWTTHSQTALVDYPAADESRAASAIAAARAYGLDVATSKAPKDWARTVRIALSAGSALIGLAGVAICVALSAAEGRADLATLAAVGASPGRRRRYAAAQALVLALFGTVIGVGFGFFFARAARPSTGAITTVVPWGDLLPILVAVPALAALIGLFGARRMPMTRRAD